MVVLPAPTETDQRVTAAALIAMWILLRQHRVQWKP